MSIQKMTEQAFDEEFGICKILHLPSIVVQSQDHGRAVPDEFEEFLDDTVGSGQIHPSVESLLTNFCISKGDVESEETSDLEILQSLLGRSIVEESQFLVQFRTNKRTYHGDDSSWTSGPGWYSVQWIAAPSIAKAWGLGLKWAKESHKSNLEESTKE